MIRPLCHVLYTNAAGGGGTGTRLLALPVERPEMPLDTVGQWLASLPRRRDGSEGWASSSFRLGAVLHACVARLPAGWERDAHGRPGGFLVHAVLMPVFEGQDCGVHAVGLMDVLRRHGSQGARDAREYLESCTPFLNLEAELPEPAVLLASANPAALLTFLDGAAAATVGAEAAHGQEGEAAAGFARAGAALPPRLRLAANWSVGLRPEAGAGSGPPPPVPDALARRDATRTYWNWLQATLEVPGAAGRVLHDWEIRSWRHLLQRLTAERSG